MYCMHLGSSPYQTITLGTQDCRMYQCVGTVLRICSCWLACCCTPSMHSACATQQLQRAGAFTGASCPQHTMSLWTVMSTFKCFVERSCAAAAATAPENSSATSESLKQALGRENVLVTVWQVAQRHAGCCRELAATTEGLASQAMQRYGELLSDTSVNTCCGTQTLL